MKKKSLVCCIIKNENLYLREWVEHYKNLHFDNIIIYDNNDINGEYPQQVIGDYISDGFVLYRDVRGLKNIQDEIYVQCYNEKREEYEWIAFFDCDEFLYEKVYDIGGFLDFWSDYNSIHFSWENISDNGLLHYDGRPLKERFGTKGILEKGAVGKVIVKTQEYNAKTYNELYNMEKFVWVEGINIIHYRTKTIEEWCCRKFGNCSYANKEVFYTKENLPFLEEKFKELFIYDGINEWSEEKEKIYNDFLEIYRKTYEKRFK